LKIAGDSSQAPAFIPAKQTGKADSLPVKQPSVQGSGQNVKFPSTESSLSGLLSSLKLPHDNLSRSIIAFARFFSLPLEPKFLTTLRREALSQAGKGAVSRESAALGSAAAADKGLKLGVKALGEYAAAIDGSIKSFSKEGAAEPRASSTEGKQESETGGGNQGENNAQPDQNGSNFRHNKQQDQKEKQDPGEKLHDYLTKTLNDKPLLDLINRIPGKNGRWIVIPFSFFQKGYEFNVSLRILLYSNILNSAESAVFERLTVDIAVKKKQKRWFISLERPKGGSSENQAASLTGSRVHIFCETRTQAEKTRLRRDLAKALNLPLDSVEIRDEQLLFADSRDDLLRSVDEEV
jgi:hypothetical protein